MKKTFHASNNWALSLACSLGIARPTSRGSGPRRSALHAGGMRGRSAACVMRGLAFSSDWNVAEMEPLIGIYTALTRKGLDGKPKGGWVPAQTIDLDTAIRAYTINGAFANFVEQNRGSITPGKYADLVMLSDDLFKIPAEKIKDTNITWTMVGGKTVWSKQ